MRRMLTTLALLLATGCLATGATALADTVIGTPAGETLTGTNLPDQMYGEDGDDTLNGLGGNDYLEAGPGDDTVNAGSGLDLLIGGAGGPPEPPRAGAARPPARPTHHAIRGG